MRAPFEKIKKADRTLKAVVIIYPFLGLMLLGFSLHIYFKHDLDWTLTKPIPIDEFESFEKADQVLVYLLLPILAVGYFLAAYSIWNYRRKRGDINDFSKIETKSEIDSRK
jgi:hypothetical protein